MANSLYEVRKVKGGYKVFNTNTNKSFSNDPQTKEEATAQMKHIMSNLAAKTLGK